MIMRRVNWLSFLSINLVIAGCGDRQAENSNPERIKTLTTYADSLVGSGEVPGLALAIIRDGAPVQQLSRGFADVANKRPVTADTPFQLASTTKIFSSTAVLLLVAEGRVRLDDPIGRFIEGLPTTWQPITVRQLLSHTSGLPDIAVRTGELELVADDWPSALKIVADKPMQFPPGDRWAYTQTNYALLLLLIERVSGEPFERFADKRLFAPLGMRQTFYPSATRRCATSYDRGADDSPAIRDLAFPAYVHAAGGLCSSLNDMVKWGISLQKGNLLPADLAKLAIEPARLANGSKVALGGPASYGLGWAIDATTGHGWAGHSGGNATAFRRYPADRLAIVVLHNGVSNPDVIADRLARMMFQDGKSGQAQADLWDAAIAGDPAGIEAALAAGADVNALDTRSSRNGRRPLNWAASNNRVTAIQLLLKRGADVNAQNLSGFTALAHAAEAGAAEAAKVLLAAGADTTLKTQAGSTAAEVARQNGHPDVAQLIDRGAKRL